MPEASSDAAILIAISWQAFNRAIRNNKETLVCDCTVVILFAAFFMEANLNHIIAKLNKSEEVKKFFKNNHPGLQDKLGWFYNEFIEKSQVENSRQLYDKGIVKKIRERFPGFEKKSISFEMIFLMENLIYLSQIVKMRKSYDSRLRTL